MGYDICLVMLKVRQDLISMINSTILAETVKRACGVINI